MTHNVFPTDSAADSDVAENLAGIRERIRQTEMRAGRQPGSVRLVAVSKRVAPERVAAAVRAGADRLGENYVQEAREKIPIVNAGVGATSAPEWHLIGHLQSNKAKYAVGLFSLIQSVDSIGLAREIDRQAEKRGLVQPILLEVDLARSPERAGLPPETVPKIANQIMEGFAHLELRGLMGMAPPVTDSEEARPYFRELRELQAALPERSREELSMGMSGDFEIAIEEGATLVRIGTALFGKRKV